MKNSNQFYLVNKKYKINNEIESFLSHSFSNYTLYYDSKVTLKILGDGSVFLGDVFDDVDKIEGLNPNNFLDVCNNLGGRWIYLSERFLFTDFLASKSIYYTTDGSVISSSLGVLRELEIIKPLLLKGYGYKSFVGLSTDYYNVKQLLPGQYYDLVNCFVVSHGSNYFNIQDISYSNILSSLSSLMKDYTEKAYSSMTSKGYYQALTGGTDSRLTLSSFLLLEMEHYTFTHKKSYFFMTNSDFSVPTTLAEKYNFQHFFTNKNNIDFDTKNYLEHIGRSADEEVGSNYYYYKNGQMELLKNKYFIDNYYETGANWLHGVGAVGKSNQLTLENFEKDGYKINEEDFEQFLHHVKSIAGEKIHQLDVLYFIKNFTSVSNLFCEMDYYMLPIAHMNSRHFFSVLLSSKKIERGGKSLLGDLIKENIPGLESFTVNKKDPLLKDFIFRAYRKLTRKFNIRK